MKINFHLWNKSLFLGVSFLVFSLIASVYWGLIYAEGTLPGTTIDGGVVVTTVPSAPSGLAYRSISSTSVSLFWSDNSSNEDKFNIERKINSTSTSNISSSWTTLTVVSGANITTYEDNTVTPGTSYSYQVQACLSNVGCSSPSILENVVVPTAVQNNNCTDVKLEIANNKTSYNTGENVSYTWTCYPSGTSANVYVSLRKPDGTFMIVNNSYPGGTQPSGTQTGMINTANFVAGNYSLKACLTTACVADPTNVGQTFTITTPTITPKTPAAPSEFSNDQLTPGFNSVTLKWKDNSDNEIKFRIKRKLSTEASYNTSYRYTYANVSYFIDNSSIVAGVSYDYSLSACASETVCSSEVELKGVTVPLAIIEEPKAPDPVTELTSESLTSASTYILLKWKDSLTTSTNKFISISRKAANETSFKLLSKITTSGVNYYKDTAVTKGVSYNYVVKVCYTDTLCSSPVELVGLLIPAPAASTEQPVVPPTVPLVPSELIKNINSNNTVTLKWRDNSSNEDRFIIERRTSLSTNFTSLSYIKSNGTSYIDSIEPGVYYEYRLKACYLTYCSSYVTLPEKVYIPKVETIPAVTTQTNPVEATVAKEPVLINEPVETTEKIAENTVTKNPVPVTTNTTNSQIVTETKVEVVPVEIREVVSVLSNVEDDNAEKIKQASNLLYKDTNKDGISDYDSKYVYNIDPVKPSPVSVIDGKTITASEKILLGFDPSKKDLVKITPEEPTISKAKSVLSYSVKKIELSKDNKIAIKGKALPNSFITIYIYSTPIMVTVRTNTNGEWEYVLDKELENGNHTIYAATVNNTGNIVAKSSAYTFTKTAEAVTLEDLPITSAKSNIEKPGIISGNRSLFVIGIGFFMALGLILILVGLFTKNNSVREGNLNL